MSYTPLDQEFTDLPEKAADALDQVKEVILKRLDCQDTVWSESHLEEIQELLIRIIKMKKDLRDL